MSVDLGGIFSVTTVFDQFIRDENTAPEVISENADPLVVHDYIIRNRKNYLLKYVRVKSHTASDIGVSDNILKDTCTGSLKPKE